MKGYFRYLPTKDLISPFKINVRGGGFSKTAPGITDYGFEHPDSHSFIYKSGRTLDEYQILYILEGGGFFESESAGKLEITEGDLFMLFPGEWHRYKPSLKTGWYEYWIGFTGDFANFFEDNELISKKSPIIKIGLDEHLLDMYTQILDVLKSYNVGADYLISGVATHLLGYVLAQQERNLLGYSEHINELINKAKIRIADKMYMSLSPEEIAAELNISHSWLRRIFKRYTGFTLKEYQIEMKLSIAKNMLLTTSKPIKEISFESGFKSQYHFSKIFKQKNKVSPLDYRKKK